MNIIKIKKFLIDHKKKIIVIAAVVVVGAIGLNAAFQPSVSRDFKAMPVKFSGYNGSGYIDSADTKETEKKGVKLAMAVAKVEAKKAGVDFAKIQKPRDDDKTYTQAMDTMGDATDRLDLLGDSDIEKYGEFFDHMEATKIDTGRNSSNLKNGDKVKLTLSDTSTKPYFKSVSVTKKVTGLKKASNVTLSEKDFKVKSEGIDGSGTFSLTFKGHDVYDSSKKTKLSNGDSVTVKSKSIDLPNVAGKKYKVGNLKFKISGLLSKTVDITNLSTIDERVRIDKLGDKYKNFKLVKAALGRSSGNTGLALTYYGKENDDDTASKYFTATYYSGVKIKAGEIKVSSLNLNPDRDADTSVMLYDLKMSPTLEEATDESESIGNQDTVQQDIKLPQ